jgi:hypothetical protein
VTPERAPVEELAMNSCNCQMMIKDELQALVRSDRPDLRERAVAHLASLLTSPEEATRRYGYELFREGIADVLFCSCLDYGSLASGFADPLVDIVTRAIEFWAASPAVGCASSTASGQAPHR